MQISLFSSHALPLLCTGKNKLPDFLNSDAAAFVGCIGAPPGFHRKPQKNELYRNRRGVSPFFVSFKTLLLFKSCEKKRTIRTQGMVPVRFPTFFHPHRKSLCIKNYEKIRLLNRIIYSAPLTNPRYPRSSAYFRNRKRRG